MADDTPKYLQIQAEITIVRCIHHEEPQAVVFNESGWIKESTMARGIKPRIAAAVVVVVVARCEVGVRGHGSLY